MIRTNNNNNQQNGRRRGRGGGQGGGMGGAPRPQGQNFGNNRLDVRQRGNATQLLDKYKTLARDAAQQGDRVVSEYYLQYADHYFRVLNEIRERQPEHQRGPRPGYDADEDGDDVGNGYNPGYAASNEGQAQRDGDRDDQGQQGEQRYEQGQRDDRQPRQYEDRSQQARGQQDSRRDENRDNARRDGNRQPERGQQDDRQAERGQQDRPQQDRPQQDRQQQDGRQRDEYRRDREPRNGPAREGNARDDGNGRSEFRDAPRRAPRELAAADDQRGEAHYEEPAQFEPAGDEPILAGIPGPATLSPVAAAADTEEAPKRRRGRPRKVVDEAPADA